MTARPDVADWPGAPAAGRDSPRALILGGVAALVLLGGGLGGWAAWGKVASAAAAAGYITAEGNRKAVQHRDGGPVAAVLVREGERVTRGQALVRLDLSDTAAEVQVLASQRDQTMVRRARLKAEAAGAALIAYPPEVAARHDREFRALIDREQDLFMARRNAYTGSVGLLHQQIEGYDRQIVGLRGKTRATGDQLVLIRQELHSLTGLLKKGYVEKSRVLALQRAAAALQGDLDGLAADIAGAENEISKAQLQIAQIDKEWRESVAKDLGDAEALMSQIEPRLVSARERLKRSDLVAPEEGYVFGLKVHSPGAVIVPGDTVLEIVPANERLVVTARIDPHDIERVHPGQAVEIHLLPYRQRYMSIIGGAVLKVSADRFQDSSQQQSWFEATITVDPDDLARSGATIIPGMPVEALIKTGERTVAAYMLDPIYHLYDFAMKEE